MKKICIILSLLLVFSCIVPVTASAEEVGGYIVLGESDNIYLNAGLTLSGYLEEITGKKFPLDKGDGLEITLLKSDSVADNGYVIETAENKVTITGNGTRGIIHGVYAFLEKYCNCDWYTSALYSIPKNEKLKIPAGEKTEYRPFFEYTETDWVSPRDLEYSLANGLSGGVYRDILPEYGGAVEYISNFAHTLTTQFCASSTYFAEHPEYFALHAAQRVPDQLCLTNEETYKIVRDEVMALLQAEHKPEESLQIISLTQHDNQKMCQCSDCRKLDDENGGHSGTMINFVNRIARDVAAAGYKNVAIDTFAYQYTRQAPTQVVPEDNVIVRLCTIECCFAHALDDESCSENAALMNDLSDWSKICDRIYVWDYTTNYANTLGIFPDFGVLQKNIQVFYENNVAGVYEEGNYYMSASDGEFGELRSYLLSKLMQNPYIDYDAYMNEFLEAYYGKGSDSIREFIDMTIAKPVEKGEHLNIYSSMADTLGFTDDDIEKADSLWEQAKAAAENEAQLQNIERSEICWRYWKAYNKFDKAQNEKLLEDIKAFGITMIHEGDSKGPDNLKFYSATLKNIGDNILFPFAIVLYAITVAAAFVLVIAALKSKPRKYIYILLFVLIGVFFEIFGWHRRAYIAWVAVDEYFLTLGLILLLYAIGGALMARGAKKRLFAAALCLAIAGGLYAFAMIVPGDLILGGGGNSFGIAAAYVLLGIEAIAILAVTIKNTIKEAKK